MAFKHMDSPVSANMPLNPSYVTQEAGIEVQEQCWHSLLQCPLFKHGHLETATLFQIIQRCLKLREGNQAYFLIEAPGIRFIRNAAKMDITRSMLFDSSNMPIHPANGISRTPFHKDDLD